DIIDIYVPSKAEHPNLRIRKNGDKIEITKKEPVEDKDSSKQLEQTIPLNALEYEELSQVKGKRVAKRRYYYNYDSREAQVDVFQEALEGLVLVDFEFNKEADMNAFTAMPEFCLVDVTQEKAFAGGMLAGKSYKDIEGKLKEYGYEPLKVA
ncbi:hypothetical protein B1A_16882, partial [mine drainage metagenome]